MTPDVAEHLSTYAAGLEAEIALLRQIGHLAGQLRAAGRERDLEQMQRIADDRERLISALVKIEHEISGIRATLAERRQEAKVLAGYDDVAALHRAAGDLVTEILTSDREAMAALREAEIARRAAAQTVGVGEATLAAYRRVVSPASGGPALVDRRG